MKIIRKILIIEDGSTDLYSDAVPNAPTWFSGLRDTDLGKIFISLCISRSWTVKNKNEASILSQNLVKTPSGDFKKVSEKF